MIGGAPDAESSIKKHWTPNRLTLSELVSTRRCGIECSDALCVPPAAGTNELGHDGPCQ